MLARGAALLVTGRSGAKLEAAAAQPLAHGVPSVVVNVTSRPASRSFRSRSHWWVCKAAIHRYTLNLRLSLPDTACRVVEIIPPAVRMSLAGGGGHGVPVDEFFDAVLAAPLAGDADEIGLGPTAAPPFEGQRCAARAQYAASSTRFPARRLSKGPLTTREP